MIKEKKKSQTAKAMKTKSNIRRLKLDPMPPRAFAMGSDCYKNQDIIKWKSTVQSRKKAIKDSAGKSVKE
jgi:hypothetical protein